MPNSVLTYYRFIKKQGKKFGSDQAEDGGEVTDEDEGAETNRTRAGRVGQASRRLRICRELSDLIALNRGSSIKLPSSRDKSKNLYSLLFNSIRHHRNIYDVLKKQALRVSR